MSLLATQMSTPRGQEVALFNNELIMRNRNTCSVNCLGGCIIQPGGESKFWSQHNWGDEMMLRERSWSQKMLRDSADTKYLGISVKWLDKVESCLPVARKSRGVGNCSPLGSIRSKEFWKLVSYRALMHSILLRYLLKMFGTVHFLFCIFH